MTGPSMLEPQFSRRDSDEPWEHWRRCGLCGEPLDPADTEVLAGFAGDVFHRTPCAADYCREHDEFDCREAHDAAR